MGTVPTGLLERRLRAEFLKWLKGVPNADDLDSYVRTYAEKASKIINSEGNRVARLGLLADFPAPKLIPLSIRPEVIYDKMQLSIIKAGIATGLNAKEIARGILNAGLGAGYRDVERLARTEVVSAYWRNQREQVDGLGLVLVWSAENGPRTCPYCLAKDGLVVEDETVRDHPNGRCTLIPKLPDRVPLRDKSRNPRFTRNHRGKELAQFDKPELTTLFGKGLDAMARNPNLEYAVTGMVSQGYTAGSVAKNLVDAEGIAGIGRDDWSTTLRHLESYAQQSWDLLDDNPLPKTLYRVEDSGTGLAQWYKTPTQARKALGEEGQLLEAETGIKGLKSFALGKGHFILSNLMVTAQGVRATQGVLNGPTPHLELGGRVMPVTPP